MVSMTHGRLRPSKWFPILHTSPKGHTVAHRLATSAKKQSNQLKWLHQSRFTPEVVSETSRQRITPCKALRRCVTLYFALQLQCQQFSSCCWSPNFNETSAVVANSDHTSELVHCVHAWITIAIQWIIGAKSLLALLLLVRKVQFSLF